MNIGDQVETSLGARGTVSKMFGTEGVYCEVSLDMGGRMAIPVAELSPVVAAWDKRAALERNHPLLAFALYVEAAGDRRADATTDASSLLTGLRDAARRALHAARGPDWRELSGKLYPVRQRSDGLIVGG